MNNFIMGSHIEIPVGTRLVPGDGSGYEGIYDHERNFHAQPCVIVREATREEYLAQYDGFPTWQEKLLTSTPGVKFYEIHTD